MAYAVVISLLQTIDHLQNSPHISVVTNSCQEIIKFAYDEIISLKESLMLLGNNNVSIGKAFSITKSVKASEAFESHLSNHFPSEYQIIKFADTYLNPLQKFIQENIISKRVNVLDEQVIGEGVNKLEDVIEPLGSKFRIAFVLSENMEERIMYFTHLVMGHKKELGRLPEEEGAPYTQFCKLDDLLTDIQKIADRVLEQVLQRLNMTMSKSRKERLSALDIQIREATCKLEDTLEAHLLNQFLLQSNQNHPLPFYLDLQEWNQDIHSFTNLVTKLKEEYINELFNPLPNEDDELDDDIFTSRIDFGGMKSKMVGYSDEFLRVGNQLIGGKSRRKVFSLFGMAGIGKTTLAKNIFEDPLISHWFNHRAWVYVGPNYRLREILLGILTQVNPCIDQMLITEGDEKLAHYLFESLKGRKYIIVLDDVWDEQLMYNLERLLPYERNGNRVLVTTRLKGIAGWYQHNMRFLNKEESWELLLEKVFGDQETCPPQLEKVGKQIAENCEGLPLTIVTVANLLSKAERTPEYWKKVALKQNSIFVDTYDQIMKVLLPSYNYLPQHLKSCFLYMGVFPQNYKITRSELIKLWSAEGFLDTHTSFTNLDEIIDHLVDSCLLIALRKSSTFKVKTCSLHTSFWYLSKREARKNKFSHIINIYADGIQEGIKSQRRLCIHNNILFGIKDVYNSMASIQLHDLFYAPVHLIHTQYQYASD